jgi:hypothetical protein
MTFTGTLIEDLMATVERAERKAHSDGVFLVEPLLAEPLLVESSMAEGSAVEPWLASVQENVDYDSKFVGVA